MSSINKGKNIGENVNQSAEQVEEIISFQEGTSNNFVETHSSEEL